MINLKIDNCSFANAVLYGNCSQHFQKAHQGGELWFGHALIALLELPPLIGQIVAIAEWALVGIANAFAKSDTPKPAMSNPAVQSNALQRMIDDLKQRASQTAAKDQSVEMKKAALLELGLERLLKARPSGPKKIEMATFDINESSKYDLTVERDPNYLSNPWNSQPLEMTTTSAFFDYAQDNQKYAVDVDFANQHLGGGWKGHGFVQEEIMVFEMPDFAFSLSQNTAYYTRMQNIGRKGPGIMAGSPRPILMKDLLRVQTIDNDKAYGNKINTISKQELLDSTLQLKNPQNVNLLAVAAPKLDTKDSAMQHSTNALKDIFNTLMAGLELANREAKAANKPLLFRSGKFGCGAFNNSPHAVYLLHCLALSQTGLEGKLYGYSNSEVKIYAESWREVSQKMTGKSLNDCLAIISKHLTDTQSQNIMTSLFNKVKSLFLQEDPSHLS